MSTDSYQLWIAQNEPKKRELDGYRQESLSFQYRPKISIITPVWNTDEKWLRLAIASVLNQVYDNWELCIADGNSTELHIEEILKEYASKDTRIKVKFLTENKGIAGNSNEALSISNGDFIALLDHDDKLAAFALYEVVKVLNRNPDVDFIYSDEDKITINEKRTAPFFKPDWSPDMFLSCMYTCHLGVYRKKIIREIGGFRSGYDGSQDYDLVLRFIEKTNSVYHIPKVLYHWRTVLGSAASGQDAKPYAYVAGKQAISDYLARNNIEGDVSDGAWSGWYRVKRKIVEKPMVSILIPSRDNVKLLRRCVESILTKTEYDDYEILIADNQSVEAETLNYHNEIRKHTKVRILEFNKPFNFSAINNYAVFQAYGEHILFLNNDTEVIAEEWLSSMLEHSQRREVGAVGVKLLYPNRTIQHCGVILGLGIDRVAGHIYQRYPNHFGYSGRISIINNYSAVTAACMMLKKEVFEEVGGFDEDLGTSYCDVDLCIKIRSRGYLIVYTPYAQLYHHESYSRGYDDTPERHKRFQEECSYMRAKWGYLIDSGDPYYNPNLTLDKGDFSICLTGCKNGSAHESR
ncbi:glycosyltransferase family 2 protein [Chloroflexota bacterium]